MINLSSVTLLIIDCIDIPRAQKALDISTKHIQFGAVKFLTSLKTNDKRKVEIPHIDSIEKYSEFCIKDLYKYVDTEFVLMIQYDGFILNPQSWTDEFLKYDYIGAPWFIEREFWFTKFGLPRELKGQTVVGNGGFSLRSKKFLETSAKLAEQGVFKKYQPEDLQLCVFHKKEMEQEGIVFAPKEVAEKFSVEGSDCVYDAQFGFHGLEWTDISKWIKENPEWNTKQGFWFLFINFFSKITRVFK